MATCRPFYFKRIIQAGALFLCWIFLMGFFMQETVKPKVTKIPNFTFTTHKYSTLEEASYKENTARIKRVQEICTKYNLGSYQKNSDEVKSFKYPPAPQYSVFYYDLTDNLSVCPVYKAGSSSWLYNLCILGGETETSINNSNEQLSTIARRLYPELEYDQAIVVLPNTKKLMTVRHPFDRILSAYRDKLENVNIRWNHGTRHFYRKYGAKIVKKYRKGGDKIKAVLKTGTYFRDTNHPKPSGYEPTFEEFVRYLIDTDLLSYADDHWIPYNLFCTPCLVDYDYINKVETMEKDQIFVIKDMQIDDKIKPTWRHKTSPNVVSQEYIIKSYFSQLTKYQIEQLYEKYKLDFEMFDYKPDKYYFYAKT